MIFNIDGQISISVSRILDTVSKNGDNEVNHSILVYFPKKDLTEDTREQLINLVGTEKDFDLSLVKDDEVVWSASDSMMLENFYVEIDNQDGREGREDVNLKFLYL